jgi:hypothetical protein
MSELVLASDDRSIPTEFVGKVEPNYFCRGWNEKRKKYCRNRAGSSTTHPGIGRCNMHGGLQEGDGRLTHGQRSRYHGLRSKRVAELMEQLENDPDPFNIRDDLNLTRALLRDYIERAGSGQTARAPEAKLLNATLDEYEILLGDEMTDVQREQLEKAREAIAQITAERALPDVVDAVRGMDIVSKIIHRVEQLRTTGAVSLDQVRRFLAAVDRVLQHRVDDEELRATIRKDVYDIRV